MGYSKNLKNKRNPVIKYVNEELKKLDDITLTDEQIFDICDNILKVVELNFKIRNNDFKMYNKYNKQILFEILPVKIFRLDYMKPEDYSKTIASINKSKKSKDLKFIYLYALKHYMSIATLYSDLNKNVMDGWITKEGDKLVLFSSNNEYINKAIETNKDIKNKLHDHIVNVKEYLDKTNYNIDTEEFYKDLKTLVDKSIKNINEICNKENQRNFYEYHLSELSNNLKDTIYMKQYCRDVINCINEYLEK